MNFSLFAPYVENVFLTGSWFSEARAMRCERGWWRVDVDVPDGRHEYKFRLTSKSPFLANQQMEVTDPRARLVDETRDDASVLHVHHGRDVTTAPDYVWEHDDTPRPKHEDLVLYELHVGEFGAHGDRLGRFEDVVRRLDYLQELGINALEVMPVACFPNDRSWGYNVRHSFAVESAYGTPEDLKRLVDACHERGMRVILDVIFNHSEQDAPLTQINFYYWYRDPRPNEISFGATFNFEHVDAKLNLRPAFDFNLEVARYWQEEFHVDGFRLDAAAMIDNFEFIQSIRDQGKRLAGDKPFFVIAEHIPEKPEIARPQGPADGAWHVTFMRKMTTVLCEGEVEGQPYDPDGALASLQPANDGYVSPHLAVNYLESHDEFTLMQKLAEHGIVDEKAQRKTKLGATLLCTAVGVPMLFQGQEFGGFRVRKPDVRPLQWELLDHEYGQQLHAHYRGLIALRHAYPALREGSFELTVRRADEGLFAFSRTLPAQQIVVVVNIRDENRCFDLPFPDGRWRELLYSYEITSSDGHLSDAIDASGAKIYLALSGDEGGETTPRLFVHRVDRRMHR